MFKTTLKISQGAGRLVSCLGALLRNKKHKAPMITTNSIQANLRPEPRTDAERALYQAMGWGGNNDGE